MSPSVEMIPLGNLALAFLPVAAVVVILYRWSVDGSTSVHAVVRMVVQLALVGYVLTSIFESDRAWVVMVTLSVMLAAASWIGLRPLHTKGGVVYGKVLLSISVGGLSILALVTQAVLSMDSWFEPRLVIPLAGMIFATSMNAVSLAAERFQAETGRGGEYLEARRTALRAALIPITNSLFAVGLVSFPGMMTGQILSGVEPLVAVRYQIMVMCMIFGSSGICAAFYLRLQKSVMPSPA